MLRRHTLEQRVLLEGARVPAGNGEVDAQVVGELADPHRALPVDDGQDRDGSHGTAAVISRWRSRLTTATSRITSLIAVTVSGRSRVTWVLVGVRHVISLIGCCKQLYR